LIFPKKKKIEFKTKQKTNYYTFARSPICSTPRAAKAFNCFRAVLARIKACLALFQAI